VTQIYLGGPGSGSPVHWHNDAVNYAVHGSKLWTMLPPPHAVYTRRHAMVDAVQVPLEAASRNQSGSVFRCVQHPGDLIYVPDGWGHGVLNLGATAGWAKSFYAPQHMYIHAPHNFVDAGKLKRAL
jgi:oxalate decarboxylase/phosphoglucose isomerase-like protein (cupin superfamily)